MPAIRFHNVSKSYAGEVVLNGLSMKVSEAETKIIMGVVALGKLLCLKWYRALSSLTQVGFLSKIKTSRQWEKMT